MNTNSCKSFYLFKGNWSEKFVELNDQVEARSQELAIWAPKDKTKNHNLIVVSGDELPPQYCLDKNIWKTDEAVFESFYEPKMDRYYIHRNYHAQAS